MTSSDSDDIGDNTSYIYETMTSVTSLTSDIKCQVTLMTLVTSDIKWQVILMTLVTSNISDKWRPWHQYHHISDKWHWWHWWHWWHRWHLSEVDVHQCALGDSLALTHGKILKNPQTTTIDVTRGTARHTAGAVLVILLTKIMDEKESFSVLVDR